MRGRVSLAFRPLPGPFAGLAGADQVDLAIAYRDFLASVAGREGMSCLAVGFTPAFRWIAELGGGTHEGRFSLYRPSNSDEDTEKSGQARVTSQLRCNHQRRSAITDHTASTRPKGQAPCRNP